MKETEGYVVIAVGEIYEQLLDRFTKSLRQFGDARPVHVITETELKKHSLYDTCNVQNERYSIFPKICMDDFAPFDHNIHIDVDALACASTDHVWDLVKSQDQFILHRGWFNDDPMVQTWNKNMAQLIRETHGLTIPRTQGAFFYLRKKDMNPDFFPFLREMWFDFEKWVCIPNFIKNHHRRSRGDQPMFSIAYSKFNLLPIDIKTSPIMTRIMTHAEYNPPYHQNYYRSIPTDQYGPKLDQPIAFTHVEQLFQKSFV